MTDKHISKRVPRGNLSLREAWKLEDASLSEVEAAHAAFKSTQKCTHIYVTFNSGWLYDECICAICKDFVAWV